MSRDVRPAAGNTPRAVRPLAVALSQGADGHASDAGIPHRQPCCKRFGRWPSAMNLGVAWKDKLDAQADREAERDKTQKPKDKRKLSEEEDEIKKLRESVMFVSESMPWPRCALRRHPARSTPTSAER